MTAPPLITYWLYHDQQVLTAVRMPPNTPHEEVINRAVQQHRSVPLQPVGCDPLTWERRLKAARVRL